MLKEEAEAIQKKHKTLETKITALTNAIDERNTKAFKQQKVRGEPREVMRSKLWLATQRSWEKLLHKERTNEHAY